MSFAAAPPGTATPYPYFHIVFLPDVHVEVYSDWEWRLIWHWIVSNKDRYNIAAIVGEGDVITDASNSSGPAEMALARIGWDAFDAAGIPNIAAIGNHDYDTDVYVSTRASALFDSGMPLSRMTGKPWYGGAMNDTSSKSSWIKFNAGGRKFLVLNLEIWPDDDMIAWGLSVCNANPDREVILVTHSHLNTDGTQTRSTDIYGPGLINGTPRSYPTNDAPGVWSKLGRVAPNLKFIVSGHVIGSEPYPKTSYLLGTGDNGNRVHQWMCNYQTINSGDSMIGLLRFPMDGGSNVHLCAYKTSTNTEDPASSLDLVW